MWLINSLDAVGATTHWLHTCCTNSWHLKCNCALQSAWLHAGCMSDVAAVGSSDTVASQSHRLLFDGNVAVTMQSKCNSRDYGLKLLLSRLKHSCFKAKVYLVAAK